MEPTESPPLTAAPASTCGCGCGGGSLCAATESSGMERTRFFPRQLVTPDDLTQDQLYFQDKGLRHNRLLHGWGVVCGARVMKHPTDQCKVVVEAGYVLGPYGHEILIDRDVAVDLCHEGIDGNAVGPCGGVDPWCSDVRISRPGGRPLYVAVKYAQCENRPVRVHGQGCGCGEAACEYSRVRDTFAIKVLSDLPSSYSDPMPQPSIDAAVRCRVDDNRQVMARTCPPCPAEPWVVLADVILTSDGQVEQIDCFAHRRYVVSFADYYFLCRPATDFDSVRGVNVLVDRRAQEVGAAPAPATMMVAISRPDASTAYLPINFDVHPGETVSSLLAREGTREFRDSQTGQVVSLADLYAMSGADPARPISSVADAVTPLQNVRLRPDDLQDVRNRLGTLVASPGVQRLAEQHANAPAAVDRLPATTLQAAEGGDARLQRLLGSMTVGEIPSLARDEFVERMAKGAAAARQEAVRAQAGAIWDNSAEAMRLTASWRAPGT